MEWITHGSAGAFVAWSWPRRWAVPRGTPIAVAAALLPDADLYIERLLKPGSPFEHRALMHSLFGVAVISPVVALLPAAFARGRGYLRFVALVALGMLTHVILDLPTEIGEKIFYPFSRRTIYLDWLGHMDFTFFLMTLFILLAAWTYSRREAALRRGLLSATLLSGVAWLIFAEWPALALRQERNWGSFELSAEALYRTSYPLILGAILLVLLLALGRDAWGFRQGRAFFGRVGLAAFLAYLLTCGGAKWLALGKIDRFTAEQGIKVLNRVAARGEGFSFVGPILWTGLVLAPEGVYEAEIRPFTRRQPEFRLYPTAPENAFVAAARSVPRVQRFLVEARFPVACYQVAGPQHLVEYYDHAEGGGVVRAAFNDRLELLAVRWLSMKDYTSNAAPSPDTPAQASVPPPESPPPPGPPCFVREGAPRPVVPSPSSPPAHAAGN